MTLLLRRLRGRARLRARRLHGRAARTRRLRRRIANDLGHEAVVAEQGMTLTV